MKKTTVAIAVLLFATASAFAHAGHAHTYMGKVTMIHSASEFMIKTTEGNDVTIKTTSNTKFLHADNHVAKVSELAIGNRVVVKMNTDGKTAASVKMSASTPKK